MIHRQLSTHAISEDGHKSSCAAPIWRDLGVASLRKLIRDDARTQLLSGMPRWTQTKNSKVHSRELIGAVNKISGVATVANGGELRRLYDDAKSNNDDARARDYIRKVRIYCEDLIKFMLRGISSQVPDLTLSQLKEEIKRLRHDHVAPFDRRPFEALINALNE